MLGACGGSGDKPRQKPAGRQSGTSSNAPGAFNIDAPKTITFEATARSTPVLLPTPTTVNGVGDVKVEGNAPAKFPLGETVVTWKATDQRGSVVQFLQTVVLKDSTPPLVTPPPDVEMTIDDNVQMAIPLGEPAVFDAFDGVTLTSDSPRMFSVGETVVTWTAIDQSGNVATATQLVILGLPALPDDVISPTLTPPQDVNVTSPDGLPVTVQLGSATATDNSGPPSVTNNAPSRFPVGLTIVSWSATDNNGNQAVATQRVIVTNATASDKVVPTLKLTKNASIGPIEASANQTTIDVGTATATDNTDGTIAVRNDAPTGGFPVGVTTVTWYATDRAGNVGVSLQKVTVVDTTPPTLTVPSNIVQSGFVSQSRIPLGAATAVDKVDGSVKATNDAPRIGLPIGDSVITWTATDRAGNTATAKQQVSLAAVACSENLTFFSQQVWPQVLGSDCLSCHTLDGVTSNFNLVDAGATDYLTKNLGTARSVALRTDGDGLSLLLSKPSNAANDHGGGERFGVNDARYSTLKELSDRLNVCVNDTSPSQQGLVLASPYQHLRRATLALAGRLPSAAEESSVTAASTPEARAVAVDAVLDGLMNEPVFLDRVKEIYNDLLLTNGLADIPALSLDLSNFARRNYYFFPNLTGQGYSGSDSNKLRRYAGQGIGYAPVELIAYVVKNNRPFTEILTADYTMVNPYTATLFGATPAGAANFGFVYGESADLRDPTDFRPAVITDRNGSRYPHAGVLTTLAFLGRYPSSPTNVNRARSRYTYQFFLDSNVEGLANRGGLDLDNLIGQFPTLEDPQCKACHDVVDPVAGLFKNWSDMGAFVGDRTNWFSERTPPEMLKPGYSIQSTDSLPSGRSGSAVSWLASRIVADNRFAVGTAKTIAQALVGPAALDDVVFIENLKTQFVASAFNLKTLVKGVVNSDYFKVMNIGPGDDPNLFSSYGLGRLQTPEQLDRKITAVTGGYQWRAPGGQSLISPATYMLLYGGIDSVDITERTTTPTGVMAAIQDRLAYQISCEVTAADFAKAPASRALFPQVAIADTPPGATENIRNNIQYLHKRILGEELALDDPQITRAFDLFVAARSVSTTGALVSECAGGLAAQDPIRVDANGTVRAWQAVLAYLLSDFRFYFE